MAKKLVIQLPVPEDCVVLKFPKSATFPNGYEIPVPSEQFNWSMRFLTEDILGRALMKEKA